MQAVLLRGNVLLYVFLSHTNCSAQEIVLVLVVFLMQTVLLRQKAVFFGPIHTAMLKQDVLASVHLCLCRSQCLRRWMPRAPLVG